VLLPPFDREPQQQEEKVLQQEQQQESVAAASGEAAPAPAREEAKGGAPAPAEAGWGQDGVRQAHFVLDGSVLGTVVMDSNEQWTVRLHQFAPEAMQLVLVDSFTIRNTIERPVAFGAIAKVAIAAAEASGSGTAAAAGGGGVDAGPGPGVPISGIEGHRVLEFTKSESLVMGRTADGKVLVRSTESALVSGSGNTSGAGNVAGNAAGESGGGNLGGSTTSESASEVDDNGDGWSVLKVPGDELVTAVAASVHHQYGLVFTESGKTYTVGDAADNANGSKKGGASGSAEPDSEAELAHSAHSHDLKFNSRQSGWNCDVCGYRSRQAPVRKRYRCTAGCDWDACGTCMEVPIAAWVAAHAPEPTAKLIPQCAVLVFMGRNVVTRWCNFKSHACWG
jgi:hypothetical protein